MNDNFLKIPHSQDNIMCYIDIVENMKSTFHMKESSRKAAMIIVAAYLLGNIIVNLNVRRWKV